MMRGSRSLDVCWTLPRTLSPGAMKLPSSGMEPPCLATARPLGLPLGSPWRCAKDASRRLLQLTSRNEHPYRSPDFRATRLAPHRPVVASRRQDEPKPTSASAATDAEPPCGNPTPDELALDGACTSFGPSGREPLLPVGSSCWASPISRAAVLAAVFSTASETAERDL